MDAATVKAMLEQHFQYASSDPDRAHAMYHPDAVLDFPQSGERFVGVENMKGWRSGYPTETKVEVREVRGAGELWISELSISYAGDDPMFGVSIQEFRDDKIARESIYVAEGFEAPEWRAKWRSRIHRKSGSPKQSPTSSDAG
jgi:SnoaL-like protein